MLVASLPTRRRPRGDREGTRPYSGTERRGTPRYYVKLPVELSSGIGTTLDVSETGLRFETRQQFPRYRHTTDPGEGVLVVNQGARPEGAGNDEQVDGRSIGEPEVRHVTTLHVIFQHAGGPTRVVIVGEVMRVEAHGTTSVVAMRVHHVYVRRDRSG